MLVSIGKVAEGIKNAKAAALQESQASMRQTLHISQQQKSGSLGTVMLAGSSTGLASPPMAAVITAAVQPEPQDITNTVVNSGTSAGVVISGPIAFALGGQWRLGFAIFAAMALAIGQTVGASLFGFMMDGLGANHAVAAFAAVALFARAARVQRAHRTLHPREELHAAIDLRVACRAVRPGCCSGSVVMKLGKEGRERFRRPGLASQGSQAVHPVVPGQKPCLPSCPSP